MFRPESAVTRKAFAVWLSGVGVGVTVAGGLETALELPPSSDLPPQPLKAATITHRARAK